MVAERLWFFICTSMFAIGRLQLTWCENGARNQTALSVGDVTGPADDLTADWTAGPRWLVSRGRGANATACSDPKPPEGLADSGRRSERPGGPRRSARNAVTTTRPKTPRPALQRNATRPATRKNDTGPKNRVNGTGGAASWPKTDKRLGGDRKPMAAAVGGGGGGPSAGKVAGAPDNRTTGTVSVVHTDFKAKYPVALWKAHGYYADDYMALINGHWFEYMPANPSSHYLLGVLYSVIAVFGCFGNALVIFMYIKSVPATRPCDRGPTRNAYILFPAVRCRCRVSRARFSTFRPNPIAVRKMIFLPSRVLGNYRVFDKTRIPGNSRVLENVDIYSSCTN